MVVISLLSSTYHHHRTSHHIASSTTPRYTHHPRPLHFLSSVFFSLHLIPSRLILTPSPPNS
ncbi:uncharacterized protein DS421_18g616590 [Arachis hypogaea]|nr:uncharacterized protein DS421_18g616590 [Arachis hypogaea]